MATKRKMSGMRPNEGTRGGFTIIEVVLVLAIAGLIFLMVFIALPALQRSQRDTHRRNDLSKVSDAITQYQTNNQGKLPRNGKKDPVGGDNATAKPTCNNAADSTEGDACRLIAQYLNGVNSAENEFVDPDGFAYGITITGLDDSYAAGNAITTLSNNGKLSHQVHIVKGARCSGEGAVKSDNSRDYVVMYKLEGSGIYCQDNG